MTRKNLKPAACLLLVVHNLFDLFHKQVFAVTETGVNRAVRVSTLVLGILLLVLSAVRDGKKTERPAVFLKKNLSDLILVLAAFGGRLFLGVLSRSLSAFSFEQLLLSMRINLPPILPALLYLVTGAASSTRSSDPQTGTPEQASSGFFDTLSRHAIGILITACLITNMALFTIAGQEFQVHLMTTPIRVGLALISFALSWWAVSYAYFWLDVVFHKKTIARNRVSWKRECSHYAFLLMICSVSAVFIYFRNLYEAVFLNAFSISLVFFVLAVLIFWKWRNVFLSDSKAALITALTMLIIMNFNLVQKLFGSLPHPFCFMVAISVALVSVSAYALKKIKPGFADIVETGAMVAAAVLLAMNILPGIPGVINKLGSKTELVTYDQETDFDLSSAPNVCYIILDEYGGPQNLDALFRFDNADFYAYLDEKRFNVSMESDNLQSLGTTVIVPDLLNLGHVTTGMNEQQLKMMMKSPYLYRFFRENGYDVDVISYPAFLDTQGWSSAPARTANFDESAGYYVLENSLLFHVWFGWVSFHEGDYATQIVRAIESYREIVTRERETPCFCLAYFMMPHRPFVYDENGVRTNYPNPNDTSVPEYYLRYLKWVNAQLQSLIDDILEKDPATILIIQSDHGVRNLPVLDPPSEKAETEPRMHNVLNCVYYKGGVFDIEGLSGINTLRKVLNAEYGTQFEMIHYE